MTEVTVRPKRWSPRQASILVHRYVGLTIAVFLTVASVTGSFLVFYQELDRALNPVLMQVTPPSPDAELLDPFEINRRVQLQLPETPNHFVNFDQKRHEAHSTWIEFAPEVWRQVFVDPYTGAVLGSRNTEDLSEGVGNLMPFIYELHYALALGDVGVWIFGIVALLWTIDCFVGVYLTFPLPTPRDGLPRKSWFARWAPMWLVHASKLFSWVFTWHRASGLWVWGMLLVFAWSAVGLNLNDVYHPVMDTLVGMDQHTHDRLAELPRPYPEPKLTLQQAHETGKRLMAAQAAQHDFTVRRELFLDYAADHGAFVYAVESTLDISTKYPDTEIYFDANDGHLIGFDAPTGGKLGNTISTWLYSLHFASVWGLWYRIFVCVMGIAVALLSVTGIWIWLRKRGKRILEIDRLGDLTS